MPAGVYRASSQ